MAEKLRGVLVTDRTQRDVNSRNEKGTYNESDLNRVLRACSWLAWRMERHGYSVSMEYFPAILIHVSVDPPGGGTAAGVLAYKGETAVVSASPAGKFEFKGWKENGQTVSNSLSYSFKAEKDRELTAVFDIPTAQESGVVGLAVVGRAIVGKEIG